MITLEQYELLEKEFGTVSSWAIWAPQRDTVKSGTGDLSVFEDDNLLNQLNPNYVFVGLNASNTHVQQNGRAQECVWGNFHSSDNRRQHDYKIRYALMNTPYWGGYMTDIIKYHAEVDSSKVARFLKDNPQVVKENIDLFNREMKILGTVPTIVAFGDKTYDILETYLHGQYKIVKVKHYSFTIGKEDYRNELLAALDSAKYY